MSDLQHQAFVDLALLFVNMKKKCCLVHRCNLTSHSPSCWVCFFQGDVLLHSPVILWMPAECSLLDFVMLEEEGACGLPITHRISRQKPKTPEDISFPQLNLCIYSRSQQLWFTTVHFGEGGEASFAEYKTSWQEQLLKHSKRGFLPDIQDSVCFCWEFLSPELIASSLQASPCFCSTAFYFPSLCHGALSSLLLLF